AAHCAPARLSLSFGMRWLATASRRLFFSPDWSTIPATMAKRKAKKPATRRKARSGATAKLPKNAVTLVVILRAREGQDLILEAELRALIAPTRREEGCLAYE